MMNKHYSGLRNFFFAVVVCSSPLLLQSPVAAEVPPLIPREVLFGNPEIAGVDLSPDGTKIAYIAPYQGVMNLWVRDLEGSVPPRLLTRQKDRPQRPASWSYDGRFLLTTRDGQGDENTVLVRIDPKTGRSVDLTPAKGVAARFEASDREVPGQLVVGLNDRDPRYHDLYVLDLETGDRRLLHRVNDGRPVSVQRLNGSWHPFMRMEPLSDGGLAYEIRLPGDGEWKPFLRFSFEEARLSSPGGFTRDGQWLYGTLSTGEDKPRFVRWSREELSRCSTDCQSELVHRATSGALGVALSDFDTGAPSVLVETDLRTKLVSVDPSVRRDFDALGKLAGANDFIVVDRDQTDRLWLVVVTSDLQGEQYWLWDRQRQKHSFLFSVQPKLDDYVLAPMESLDLKARDGLRLPAYLTRTTMAPDGPQPLVLVVHGGPQARDYWGLDRTHQWLANRGYHVMSVNYRGSTGFGKAHLLAGQGEWYARMQDDLVDAVRWAIAEGIADPNRVVIKGASYGGYAALAGLTRDPSLFAAAVSEVGPSNLRTLLASIPAYWEAIRINWERMIGVGTVDLDAISPINHVSKIQSPLLLGHGANDPRVKLQESESIAAAMKARNLPIDFVVFPDEGHGWANPRNALAWAALEEAFLQQHIGGRAEPVGDVFRQSSMEWRRRSLPIP
jgi:dipeptidyl aminopeptidase/acylaminoacyl peptidase